MGFFTKKSEDNDAYQVAVGVASSGGAVGDKTSVVQVIRSRFYGKKGKEREDQTAISFIGGLSAAQALSNPNVSVASTPSITSPSRREAGPSSLRNERPLPATPPPPTKKRPTDRVPPSPLSRSQRDTPGPSSHVKTESINTHTPSTPPRKTTDTVTVTLAQRLNELAVANSEGLLNDDEYRLLRQNLFERFASNATVPTETPLVPIAPARPRPRKGGATPDRPTSTRPLSNFQVETPRPASITSRASAGSAVADLFRRATGRRSGSKDLSDTASVWSSTSNTSFFRLPRTLSKKSSNSSVRTTASRQPDTVSISSRRPGSDREKGDLPPKSPAPRSHTGSIRKLATPPSSFPNRAIGQESRNMSIYNVFDEDHLVSAKEIQQEILNVEAEARRLMDAFNGLEVTALAKYQRNHVRPSLRSADFGRSSNTDSNWGADSSEARSQRRINLADDTMSMRSGTSSVTPSLARSAYSAKKTTRSKTQLNPSVSMPATHSRPGSLHRKNSTSSVTSDKKSGKAVATPPVPTLPHSFSHGHLKAASSSNISLARSMGHQPMNTVLEDERASTIRMEPDEVGTEMDDIRRRREEVQQRYDARLEYLRAKLKGAQLHEKLLRK